MILFIKERIKRRIKHFKEKRANDTNQKKQTTTASTGLENGPSGNVLDYGILFGGTLTKDLNN